MIRVNGTHVEWREGMTVTDALRAMGYDYSMISVFVDGRHVPDDLHDEFVLRDDAEVQALHLHHGG